MTKRMPKPVSHMAARWAVVNEYKKNTKQSVNQLSINAGVSWKTAKKWRDHYQQYKTIDSICKPGPRPGTHTKSTTQNIEDVLPTIIGRNPQQSVRDAAISRGVSTNTIHRAAKRVGIVQALGPRKAYISPKHRADRLAFARKYRRNYKNTSWAHVFFTDSKVDKII